MPYGRGGAGNIQNVEEAKKRASDDLEANRAAAEGASTGQLSEQARTETKSSSNQQYAYTGRGGAGNWYSPQRLSETGSFSSMTDPTSVRSPSLSIRPPSEPKYSGRGGVGNYVSNAEETERARKEAEQKEIELREWVERDVEAGLPSPERVHVRSSGVKDKPDDIS